MSKVDWLSLVCGLSATGHEASKHDERGMGARVGMHGARNAR